MSTISGDPVALLRAALENTQRAKRLLNDLAKLAERPEGLPVRAVHRQMCEITRHLRGASAAADGLEQLAAGNPPPHLG
jgi:hypothetical protein